MDSLTSQNADQTALAATEGFDVDPAAAAAAGNTNPVLSADDVSVTVDTSTSVTAAPVNPSFTLEDVSKHCSDTDRWIVVGGRVFNVTEFVATHPGGPEVFASGGPDFTESFEQIGHSEYAKSLLDKYYVGDLFGFVPEAPSVDGNSGCILG